MDANGASSSSSEAVPTVLKKLEKWANYPSSGEPVRPTLFIPCKSPFSIKIMETWALSDPPRYPLTVPQLMSEQATRGRKIGLILDLSNVS